MKNFLQAKSHFFGVFFVMLVIFSAAMVYSRMGGVVGKTQLNGNGCTCHGQNSSSDVNVSILGPDEVEVNSTADFQVEISGGPAMRGGTNIAASLGTLIAGDLLRLEDSELTHTSPVEFSEGKVVFEFQYTAPAEPGSAILYAVGNSVNGSMTTSGDKWNFAPNKNLTITDVSSSIVNPSATTPNKFALKQNYPNPFNPSTSIPFSLEKRGLVKLQIYDMLGREVATLVEEFREAGNHIVNFNASALNSGTYMYRLTTDSESQSRKMLLLK